MRLKENSLIPDAPTAHVYLCLYVYKPTSAKYVVYKIGCASYTLKLAFVQQLIVYTTY